MEYTGTYLNLLRKKAFFTVLLLFSVSLSYGQNDVMMQAFYWDVPVDAANKNGTWWDNLRLKSDGMKSAGFTGLWVPAPSKGNFGIYDMGYGVFDHYDLGNYNQKGTIETRFGSRSELESMITTMHNNKIAVYADIILNHIYTNDEQSESNPAVKKYVFDHALRNGTQYQVYPTNEITWVIPAATAGDYYIQIKGYMLPWTVDKGERGYDVNINWTGVAANGTPVWETEPNNGSGQFNVFPGSGRTMQAHIGSQSDIDEYKITLTSTRDIVIRLTAKKEKQNPFEWVWTAQENGYYPVAVWKNGVNLASTSLQARTNTKINYVNHTGTGEANYSWNYTHFHPVDNNDWLGFAGSDEIITNTKFFGNDINTFNSTVQTRFKNWGYWLANQIKFDGFRLDFVRGFQEAYVADWVKNLPLLNGQKRFVVGEYWGGANRIKNWVNTVGMNGADVDAFDFPLKSSLTSMCNGSQSSFDMRWLNHAGMVRNNEGHALSGTSVVTFVENHDTGKEHDKWITKDFKMAYSYILTHEGKPCVYYPHYYGVKLVDNHDPSYTVTPPASLKEDINKLMFARRTYMNGSITVLSQIGHPYPEADAANVYIARRQGNSTKSGAIIAINNHGSSTKGLWVDSSPSGFSNLANTTLVNAFNPSQTTVVQADGRVFISAPARGYTIWVKKSDYVAYSAPSTTTSSLNNYEQTMNLEAIETSEISEEYHVKQNHPNPFERSTIIEFNIREKGVVSVQVFDIQGVLQETLFEGDLSSGSHEIVWDASPHLPEGTYFYHVYYNNKRIVKRMILLK